MANFYANLDAGLTKSKALAEAKRNYLKTHSLSETSPYYWSSIVLVGDSGVVDMSAGYTNLYLIIGLIFISALMILFRKRLKK